MVRALIEEANTLNDTPDGAAAFVDRLVRLQFAFLSAAVAARATYDPGFRKDLQDAIAGQSGVAADEAFLEQARIAMPVNQH